MSLAAIVADPLTEPVPAGWDAFVDQHRLPPMWRSPVLRELDWCARSASSMVVVNESSSTQPVALFHVRHLETARWGRFAHPGGVAPAGLTDCHLDSALATGFAFSDALDDHDRAEALRVFERALRRRRSRGWIAFAYRYLRDRHLAMVPALGRVRLRQSPMMVLPNDWSDVASYLAWLPAKWRYQLRKIRHTVGADADLRVDLADNVDPQEACWLAEVVRRRHQPRHLPRPPRSPRYFRALAGLPGMRFLTYRDASGRLIGYVGFHDDGRDLLPIWWGTRADRDGGRANLYFDQYLRLAELMISTGRRRLLLGPGMPHIKARYGARPEHRWAVVGL